jgi:hypothetical protein
VEVDSVPTRSAVLGDGISIGSLLDLKSIESFPLANGRSLQSFVRMVPGIVFTDPKGSLAQFTATGQRRFSNRLTIDGVSGDLGIGTRDIALGDNGIGLPAFATSGGTQTLVPLAAIDEIQVRTTSASAEHARAAGAQIAIVTKSGSSKPTTEAFLHVRPRAWNASDWFTNAGFDQQREDTNGRPTYRSTSYRNVGASVGGPVFSSRISSFVTWEREAIDRPVTTTTLVPSLGARDSAVPDVRPVLDAFPRPNGREVGQGLAELSRTFPIASRLWVLSARVDASLSTRHRLFVRVNVGRSAGDELDTVQKVPRLSFDSRESSKTDTTTVGMRSTFKRAIHDLRVNVSGNGVALAAGPASYGGAQPLPIDVLAPNAVSAADSSVRFVFQPSTGGTIGSGLSAANRQSQLQLGDSWTVSLGRHEWRCGIDYRRVTAESDSARERYSVRFRDLSEFLQGRPATLNAGRYTPARARVESWATFAEDTWRWRRLTLQAGARYAVKPAPFSVNESEPLLARYAVLPEVEFVPSGARLWQTSLTDIGPHLGVAYKFRENGGAESILRGGWSLVFDEATNPAVRVFGAGYPYSAWRQARSSLPIRGELSLDSIPSFEEAIGAEAYAFPDHMRSPRTQEWQVGIDQSIGKAQRLGVTYVGTAGRDLLYWHEYHVGPVGQDIQAYSNEGQSDYHGLLVDFVRRQSRGFRGRVAYTWSHAIDLDSGESLRPGPPSRYACFACSRGSADFDRRHVLRAEASYDLPVALGPNWLRAALGGWTADIVTSVISGGPVDVSYPQDVGFGMYYLRVDAVPNTAAWMDDPTSPTGRRINAAAFRLQTEPRQGTLGRNALRGTPLRQVDVALSRSFRCGGGAIDVRADAFNVLNLVNVGPPVSDWGSLSFGRPAETYADALGSGTLSQGGLSPVQQLGGPRSIQLGVRFRW